MISAKACECNSITRMFRKYFKGELELKKEEKGQPQLSFEIC